MRRVVKPEILDGLEPFDPAARRSRRDLRLINALMANERWVESAFRRHSFRRLVEIGAGDGHLARRLARRFPKREVAGLDLLPAPAALPANMSWMKQDLQKGWGNLEADALTGVMILHHFSDQALGAFGQTLSRFRLLCFCEPWRSRPTLALGKLLFPVVGAVTKHDMLVSIRAGFQEGELAELLGLRGWTIEERSDVRGAIRFLAWRP